MSDDDREIDIESDVSLYLVFYLCNVVINNVFYAVDIASNCTFFDFISFYLYRKMILIQGLIQDKMQIVNISLR